MLKQLLNNSKTAFKSPKNDFFDPENGQNEKFNFGDHISTFRAKNTPKSGPYKTKNNAQTTSEQLQTNFQKFQKTVFCDPENGQNDPLRGPNFEPKILILEVIYRSFELKIHIK